MLVKHNLVNLIAPLDSYDSGEYISRDVPSTSSNQAMLFSSQKDYSKPINGLVDGEVYTFSAYVKDVTGESPILTFRHADTRENVPLSMEYAKKSFTFKYDATANVNYIAVFIGEAGKTGGKKIKVKLPKVTLGDADDVYLPNINTLPEDKQPLLPPEGNYKEIQAL